MTKHLTRRAFIVDTGCLCGGVLAAANLGRSAFAAAERPEWLATCRDAVVRSSGQSDIWSALRLVGAEGVEIEVPPDLSMPSLFHPTVKYTAATTAGVERLAADVRAANQQITAFCMHNQFEQADAEFDRCTRLAQAAQTLGVKVIRIDVIPVTLPRPKFLKSTIATITKILAATESTGVVFGVENHSNTTNDPTFLRALLDGVGSKRMGVTLDVGNFYWFGHPLSKVYELCEEFGPRVFHTHCKNIRYPAGEREKQRPMGWEYGKYACPIDQGDIDYHRVAAILQKAGYHNDLCIEDETLGNHPAPKATEILTREIRFLKQVRSGLSA
jgi:sugar phosphate isomerase/epimerase